MAFIPAPGGVLEGFGIAGATFDVSAGQITGTAVSPAQMEPFCGSGTFAEPDAEPGFLCVFAEVEEGVVPYDVAPIFGLNEPSPQWESPSPENGAIVPYTLKEEGIAFESPGGYAKGSWAVNTDTE